MEPSLSESTWEPPADLQTYHPRNAAEFRLILGLDSGAYGKIFGGISFEWYNISTKKWSRKIIFRYLWYTQILTSV